MAKILYNGADPFDGISTIPLISRVSSQSYQNRLNGIVSSFSLQGRIHVDNLCERITLGEFPNRLAAFFSARASIINSFSQNFKQLLVLDRADNVVFTGDHCLIRSINFEEDRYFDYIPYSISIDVYTKGFAEIGILDPTEDWTYENNDDGTGILVHRVTCSSINTDLQAIENAKNFVELRSGTSEIVTPLFHDYQNPILKYKRIAVNRLTGEISLEEGYIYDTISRSPSAKGFMNYITEIRENQKVIDIAISGKVVGGINSEIDDLRAIFYTYDWLAVANTVYSGADLSTQPIEFSTSEDRTKKEIIFSILYSSSKYSGPYLIDSTTISEGKQDNSYCIKFKGFIRSDKGCKGKRFEDIKSYYNSLNIESIVAEKMAKFGNPAIKLNTKAKAKSYSESIFEPSISFDVTYCKVKGEACGCLDSLEYKLNFGPAIPIYSAAPSIDGLGCYYVQDLGYLRRASFSISGTALVSNCCTFEKGLQDLRTKLNELNTKYFTATEKVLESYNTSINQLYRTINFEVTWSGIQTCPLPDNLKVCST